MQIQKAAYNKKRTQLEAKQAERTRVVNKLKQLKDSIATSQKENLFTC